MKEKLMNNKSYIIIGVIVILIIAVFIGKQVVSNKANTVNNTTDNTQNEVAIYKTYKVYNFGQELCPACVKMDPIYEKVKKEYGGKISFQYIDVNDDISLSYKYQIAYTPTFVVVDENGKMVDKLVGYVDEPTFKNFIDKWSNK